MITNQTRLVGRGNHRMYNLGRILSPPFVPHYFSEGKEVQQDGMPNEAGISDIFMAEVVTAYSDKDTGTFKPLSACPSLHSIQETQASIYIGITL